MDESYEQLNEASIRGDAGLRKRLDYPAGSLKTQGLVTGVNHQLACPQHLPRRQLRVSRPDCDRPEIARPSSKCSLQFYTRCTHCWPPLGTPTTRLLFEPNATGVPPARWHLARQASRLKSYFATVAQDGIV